MKRNAPLSFMLSLVLSLSLFPEAYAEISGTGSRVLVPFELVGTRAQHHLIAWFTGHPEYESVEAFSYGNGKIRAILTRYGGAQIDAFNYDRPDITSGRDWYASDIGLTLAKNGKDAMLEMALPDGERLVLSFHGADKPSPRYGGLTDPGNHSADTGLPAMFRKASAVSGPDSTISIGGRSYAIPMDKEISRPPFFTAYSAFLSEGFDSLFIRAYAERPVTALECPGRTDANSGAQKEEPVRVSYRTGVSVNLVTIDRRGAGNGIASIVSSTGELSGDGAASTNDGAELRFEPALADMESIHEGEERKSHFSILFDRGRSKAIEGTATVTRKGNDVTVTLRPEIPDRLRSSRSIRYDIKLGADHPLGSATVTAGNR